MLGVDVSEIQGEIDWESVKSDGISFAMIRVGLRGTSEGTISPDEDFERNYEGATAAGLKCGAYFFSQAITEKEAIEEAEYVLKTLDKRHLDYPVAFDLEATSEDWRTYGNDPKLVAKIARAFCERIQKGGYDVMIYGNYVDLDAMLKQFELPEFDTWYADYSSYPAATYKCKMWQFSDGANVKGIESGVDLNLDMSSLS